MSMRELSRERPGRERPLWGLVALGLVFFLRPLFSGEAFYYRDIFYLSAGQLGFLAESLRAGELPLWNPFHNGGMPFLADVNNQPLYPLSYLALLFDPYKAITVGIVLHVLAASAAVYLLARRLRCGPPAAFLAGTVFGYCGFTLGQGSFPGRMAALAYLPLLVLAWQAFVEEGRPRYFLLAALAGALQVLAGAPPISAVTFLVALAWGFACARSPWPPRRQLGAWLLLGGAVALLCAVQLLPLAEMARLSSRGLGVTLDDFGGFSMSPRRLPELVVPGFLGRDTMDPGDYWGRTIVDGAIPYVVSIYFGAVVLGLALYGALAREGHLSRRARCFLAGLAGLGVVAAMGRHLPGFETFYHLVPPARTFRYPSKLVILSVLPLAILAAAGCEALFSEALFSSRRRPRLLAAAWTLAALGGAFWLVWPRTPALEVFFFAHQGPEITAGVTAGLAHSLGFFVLAALVASLGRFRGDAGRWALAAVVAADLLLWGRQINPTAPVEVLRAAPAATERVAAALTAGRQTPGRLYRVRGPLPEHGDPPTEDPIWRHLLRRETFSNYEGAKLGLPVVFHEDFHGMTPSRTVEMAYLVTTFDWPRRLPLLSSAAASAVITSERLELDGFVLAATLPSPGATPVYLYRNRRAVERATVVTDWRVFAEPREALRAMLQPGFDPRSHAVLERPLPAAPRPLCDAKARVALRELSRHHRVVDVTTACPSLLVLSEVFHPGFVARVDGERAPLVHANFAWSGVFLEAGEHRVSHRFLPRSLFAGTALSTLAALLWIGGFIADARRGVVEQRGAR